MLANFRYKISPARFPFKLNDWDQRRVEFGEEEGLVITALFRELKDHLDKTLPNCIFVAFVKNLPSRLSKNSV